jgi:hypothetical protein
MALDYVPDTFMKRSVPPGVAGWGERKGDIEDCGRIEIYRYCPACAYEMRRLKRESAYAKKTAEPIHTEIEETEEVPYWKKKYERARIKNAQLRLQIVDLEIQIKNLTKLKAGGSSTSV